MENLKNLGQLMKSEWDQRIDLDPDFWMAEWAESFDDWLASGRRDFSSIVHNLLQDQAKNLHALEYGCGTGRLTLAGADYFHRLKAVDVSESAVRTAQTRLKNLKNVIIDQCSGTSLENEPSELYDFAYSYAVLGQVECSVFASILIELVRVLKIGGNFSVQLYVGNSPKRPPLTDTLTVRGYDEDSLIKAMELLGCSPPTIRPYVLPFDGTFEKSLHPVILHAQRQKSEILIQAEELCALLIASKQVIEPSFIECSVLYDRFNRLVKQGDFNSALKTANFLLEKETRPDRKTELENIIKLLPLQKN